MLFLRLAMVGEVVAVIALLAVLVFESSSESAQRAADEDRDRSDFRALKKRANKARDFPANTDPCSRHAYLMAENMVKKRGYPMLAEEPWHCAISIMSTVAALWEARNALATPPAGLDARRKFTDEQIAEAVAAMKATPEELSFQHEPNPLLQSLDDMLYAAYADGRADEREDILRTLKERK